MNKRKTVASYKKAKLFKKLLWVGIEIALVKLNPEQAVLSCCSVPERGIAQVGLQCTGGDCNPVCNACTGTMYSMSS